MCVPARAAVRLTRRGRLLITLVVVTALTMTVMAFAGVLTPSASAATSLVDRAITVSAGQTLSEVAVAQLSNLPVNEAVARIQLANGLNSSQVHAGQSLLIPQMP
jgi:cell division protein YceG involved in septum cleavage